MPGDVFLPNQVPVTMTREAFLAVLDDLRASIATDDSMEGSLAYEWGDEPGVYRVAGALRVGNSQGQGGLRLLRGDA